MIRSLVERVAKEPPFRLLAKLVVRSLPLSLFTKARWDAVNRPHYLFGILAAVEQARREDRGSISVVEFGVAEGEGLLAMQAHALGLEAETGMPISVYGFDSGAGLPQGTEDYRDHPDVWKAGDYTMGDRLPSILPPRTSLVLGDVRETVKTHGFAAPLGFIVMDLDLYTSTLGALQVLQRQDVQLLNRVAMYFDDTRASYNHRFAGELLAIEDFNRSCATVKIDRWRGIESGRPFPEADWLKGMYIAHNLAAIGRVELERQPARMR